MYINILSDYNFTFLTLEFSISDHTYENNTTIDQLTVEENTEEDIIADDLQIRDDIVLGVQEKKKGHLKPGKKISIKYYVWKVSLI